MHLPRFVKRRVDKIHLMNSTDNWNYVNTAHNPADVGTRDNKAKKSYCLALWLKGPKFLCESDLDARSPVNVVSARKAGIIDESLTCGNNQNLNSVIEIAPDLYALTKGICLSYCFQTVYYG